MSSRFFVLLALSIQLISCVSHEVKESRPFELAGRDYLYQKTMWSFTGRMVISDQDQSLSASITWDHYQEKDSIELSGVFGQGRTIIELTENQIIVDDGDERLRYVGKADDLVSELLGLKVPVTFLRFWVRGLAFPEKEYVAIENGFKQSEWQVRYMQMQLSGLDELPRKIKIENEKAILKLVINQWQ